MQQANRDHLCQRRRCESEEEGKGGCQLEAAHLIARLTACGVAQLWAEGRTQGIPGCLRLMYDDRVMACKQGVPCSQHYVPRQCIRHSSKSQVLTRHEMLLLPPVQVVDVREVDGVVKHRGVVHIKLQLRAWGGGVIREIMINQSYTCE